MKKILFFGLAMIGSSVAILGGCGGSASTNESVTKAVNLDTTAEEIINDFIESQVKATYSPEKGVTECTPIYLATYNMIDTSISVEGFDDFFRDESLQQDESQIRKWDESLLKAEQTQQDLINTLNQKLSEKGIDGSNIEHSLRAYTLDGEILYFITNGSLTYDFFPRSQNIVLTSVNTATSSETETIETTNLNETTVNENGLSDLQLFYLSLNENDSIEDVKHKAEERGYFVNSASIIIAERMWISEHETIGLGDGAETWYRYDNDSIHLFFSNDGKLSSKDYRYQDDLITVSYSYYDNEIEIDNNISGEVGSGNLDIPTEKFDNLEDALKYVNNNR